MQNELNPKANPSENNSVNPIARHNARRYALQAMYQWQIASTAIDVIETEFLRYHIDKNLDLAYFKELIHGIAKQQPTLDQTMQPFLERGLHEIDAIELAVLRLAIYELINRPDVPYPVIINEALKLAKKFGSIDGYKFVNGILDKVAKQYRVTEVGMGRDRKTS